MKEVVSNSTRIYRLNPEKYRKQARDRYWKNREKMVQRRREYCKKYPDRIVHQRRVGSYKKFYGISLEVYDQMFSLQNGVCGVCEGFPVGKKYLDVDHNHTTGKVRGLLCSNCNTAIGLAKESVERLEKMIKYLKKHDLF